jgi:hypothetical protein
VEQGKRSTRKSEDCSAPPAPTPKGWWGGAVEHGALTLTARQVEQRVERRRSQICVVCDRERTLHYPNWMHRPARPAEGRPLLLADVHRSSDGELAGLFTVVRPDQFQGSGDTVRVSYHNEIEFFSGFRVRRRPEAPLAPGGRPRKAPSKGIDIAFIRLALVFKL